MSVAYMFCCIEDVVLRFVREDGDNFSVGVRFHIVGYAPSASCGVGGEDGGASTEVYAMPWPGSSHREVTPGITRFCVDASWTMASARRVWGVGA